jgi:hypothetical protein
MKHMSLGRFILVRAGNPSRIKFVGQIILEGKPIDVKAKSLRVPPYEGFCALDADDMAKAIKNYKVTEVGKTGGRFQGPGDMNGWSFEKIKVAAKEGGVQERFLLRDGRGQPIIGDIDRLAVMEFNTSGKAIGTKNIAVKLENVGKVADDPNEIAWFNREMAKLTGKQAVNVDPAKHGPSNTFLKEETGMSRWNADTNEQLLLFSNGQAFEMTWNEWIQFMRCNNKIGIDEVFKAVPQ